MLTTPERSHRTPHSAARASGVACCMMFGRVRRDDRHEVAGELEHQPDDRDPVQAVDESGQVHQGAVARRQGRGGGLVGDPGLDAAQAEEPAQDRAGDEEQQDRGLQHVDQLDRDRRP